MLRRHRSRRPTAVQQQKATVTLLKAFFAYALKGDRRGLPVLTGTTPVDGVTTEAFGVS
ncbi:hypothetical protein [Paractinoplanes lichenicola]|uniref:Uncharacterized protein n=1 Tax=Paractinoplanes lichenicola TaxID=2802976 RepID=A0ABS1VLR0_9ACTN|nr:hypothetical protein [Actinoplanes lichenicola]MBL7255538.1 hypothetical protein [Actinoplanes lichenicola]